MGRQQGGKGHRRRQGQQKAVDRKRRERLSRFNTTLGAGSSAAGQGATGAVARAIVGDAASRRSAKRALCQEPAASVPRAPATQTITTTSAVCGDAASATNPPAASMIAAANCVGAMARSASAVVSAGLGTGPWESDQVPNPADSHRRTHAQHARDQHGLTIRVRRGTGMPGSTGGAYRRQDQCADPSRFRCRFGSGGSPGTSRQQGWAAGCWAGAWHGHRRPSRPAAGAGNATGAGAGRAPAQEPARSRAGCPGCGHPEAVDDGVGGGAIGDRLRRRRWSPTTTPGICPARTWR